MSMTLGIVKPDAVRAGSTGAILSHLEAAGFRIRGLKMLRLTDVQAKAFYEVHAERPFYGSLVAFMTSGPCTPVALEHDGDAVPKLRELMGATDVSQAAEGTIRKQFGTSIEENAIHGSDSDENATKEIGFFFSRHEIEQTA